jgi:Family of unknown function (DUF5880)
MITATTTTTRTTTTTVGLLPTLPGSSGGGGDIARFLHSSGPIVTAVLLKADATVEQLAIDTTPQKQSVQQVLGGPFTFLGQYEEEGIVLMCLRGGEGNEEEEGHEGNVVDNNSNNKKKRLPINQHKLQPPFDESQVRGDILCLRVAAQDDDDDDANHHSNGLTISTQSNEEFFLNYTLEEYMRFAARTDVKAPNVLVSEDAEDEDDEDHATGSEEEEDEDDEEMEGESDDDDDDDEDGPEGFIEMLMGQVIHRFQTEHGRLPDDTELQALQAAIAQKTGGLLS